MGAAKEVADNLAVGRVKHHVTQDVYNHVIKVVEMEIIFNRSFVIKDSFFISDFQSASLRDTFG